MLDLNTYMSLSHLVAAVVGGLAAKPSMWVLSAMWGKAKASFKK